MQDENSVAFSLSPPARETNSALVWFIGQLESELRCMGMRAISRKVSSLDFGMLSYASSQGHISVFVLSPRDPASSWQIRTLYFRPWLRRLLSPLPPKGAIDQMDQLRDWIQRFLVTHDANQIRWMSAAEAEARLRTGSSEE